MSWFINHLPVALWQTMGDLSRKTGSYHYHLSSRWHVWHRRRHLPKIPPYMCWLQEEQHGQCWNATCTNAGLEDSGGILTALPGCCGVNEMGGGRIKQPLEQPCILVLLPIPAIVLANTVLAWSNWPAQIVVGAVHGDEWRGQEEVVMVHTWAHVIMELAWPSSSGSSSCC